MKKKEKGFTLLEILLVIAAMAILSAIVIVAVNPRKQLSITRDSNRWADISTILDAFYQFSIDSGGDLPASIIGPISDGNNLPDPPFEEADYVYYVLGSDTDGNPTCADTCNALALRSITPEANCVDVSGDLVPEYISGMPIDPGPGSTENSGYYVARTGVNGGRITVGSCNQGS